ncbi:MAG TPA: biotin-dependent carboxyltransferase family protein [Candidatus Ignatzschineria merdigallinarum]|uniref:Biotin-dependent carboxyltransferase family protein n=1 Tax=Candidatus Ignatzschineria merdigallinarum TaxID=2838621 RepID=A0A9D1Q7Z9_9GAMM|nr:biotin-dependent carboxyltransferase family protein [Candidatus Ignatzschineria merdigallinarum]
MNRTIEILKPGLASTIQDEGRQGYYHLGIPPSGAMDQYSYYGANLLVGNPKNAAVIECTFLAPEMKFNSDAVIAVTGGNCIPKINGEERSANERLEIKAGDILSFGFMTAGARAYIAVAGGIDVPIILGSRSTYILGAVGGHQGRKLIAGDVLHIGDLVTIMPKKTSIPEMYQQALPKTAEIRVTPGLYDHLLTKEGQQDFYEMTWKVSSESDRIGYRCKGEKLLGFIDRQAPFGAGANPSNIVDAPYPVGSIQIPGGKEPIILHRDSVSGGGYAMIATVISADMDLIGQLQPNHTMKFIAVTMDEALAARKVYQERVKSLFDFFEVEQ